MKVEAPKGAFFLENWFKLSDSGLSFLQDQYEIINSFSSDNR